jgi:hypothetical protein
MREIINRIVSERLNIHDTHNKHSRFLLKYNKINVTTTEKLKLILCIKYII